ncbi:PspA/IM30 family protein [Halalkalibacterium ligniniphilum]|uniref:PspA/IM30 family protein n=1 Tax=Halalkalibacterium ligniniphilum TaxID=1134413 RepID=UPI0003449535|nr:PspA/IM30 family protein [Halalkalibacterium ligniniphilum]
MVMKRIRNVVMASIHEGLDKIEEPVMMLNQYMRDVQAEMKRAEAAIEKQKKLHLSLERDYQEAIELKERRDKQAEAALKAGEEDLAKRALYSKKAAAEQVNRYQALLEKSKAHVHQLRLQLEDMEVKYEKLRDKKRELVLRAQASKANAQMNRTAAAFSIKNAEEEFLRVEERIVDTELYETNRRTSQGFSREFEQEVENEFEALKAKVASAQS